jgi:chemotaxis protein CheY-P-specific phosphatase CheC
MTTRVLICDDSNFARKQMARALPRDWDVEVSFACNGEEGIENIKAGNAELLFLDLNMPVMDGYEALQAIRSQDLPTMVVVVSGDIQPEAYERVMQMGAIGFIKKPVDTAQLDDLLSAYGIKRDAGTVGVGTDKDSRVTALDCYQEIANVAMGRAADLLARYLGVFVKMPIPNINMLEASDLNMMLREVGRGKAVSSVCQGFIGSGIAGEALLTFNESGFSEISKLMNHQGEIDNATELELLMDISNMLFGACLNGIADQLDMHFSQGHPAVLQRHMLSRDTLQCRKNDSKKALAIEVGCEIEGRDINCDVLLLFTEDSMPMLDKRIGYAGS